MPSHFITALLVATVLTVPIVATHQEAYLRHRRDSGGEPSSSYASLSGDSGSKGTGYGAPAPNYGAPAPSYGAPATSYMENMYSAVPSMVYALVPENMMKEAKEEMKGEEKPKQMPKEEKKCAVQKVLPPLIIITIFIGLILGHLVAPTLLPAFVNPFVNPLVATINAITGQPNGRQLDQPLRNSFDPLLEATARVGDAISDEVCFASLLCEAAAASPTGWPALRLLKPVVPERYHSYVDILATEAGDCHSRYPCPSDGDNEEKDNQV